MTAALSIRSPQIQIGTAGGQLTEGVARMRPMLSAAGTVSYGESIASRIVSSAMTEFRAGALSVDLSAYLYFPVFKAGVHGNGIVGEA